MKKSGILLRSLMLFVLAFGLLMIFPPNELYANTSDSEETVTTTEQTDETAGASQQTAEATEETDETAGASEQKFEHYEPLPIEPVKREANNMLLGGGLVVAAITIGGAFLIDLRR